MAVEPGATTVSDGSAVIVGGRGSPVQEMMGERECSSKGDEEGLEGIEWRKQLYGSSPITVTDPSLLVTTVSGSREFLASQR